MTIIQNDNNFVHWAFPVSAFRKLLFLVRFFVDTLTPTHRYVSIVFKWERSQLATQLIQLHFGCIYSLITHLQKRYTYLWMRHFNLLCNQLDFVPGLSVVFMIVTPVIKMEVKDFRIVFLTTFSSIGFNNEF